MKTIKTFADSVLAGAAQAQLAAAGIDSFLPDEASCAIGYGNVIGVRLQVREDRVDDALRVLEDGEGFEPLPADFEVAPRETSMDSRGESAQATAILELTWSFVVGGVCALVLPFFILVLVGGTVSISRGGVLFLFLCGGLIGLIARAFYRRGKRDGLRDLD